MSQEKALESVEVLLLVGCFQDFLDGIGLAGVDQIAEHFDGDRL